jgi:integrase
MAKRGKGEGSVRKRPDGRWEARVWILDGDKRKQKSVYGDSHAEAIKNLKTIQAQYAISGNVEAKKFGDLKRLWLEHVREYRAPATYRLAKLTAGYITIRDSVRLNQITVQTVDDMMRGYRGQIRPDGTNYPGEPGKARRALLTLRALLNWAIRKQYLLTNAAVSSTVPVAPRRKKMQMLSQDDVKRLLRAAETFRDGHYYALFMVAVYTAARQGEIWALTFGDFDARKRTIRIEATLGETLSGTLVRKEPKTQASRRTLNLPQGVAREPVKPGDFIFTSTEGCPIRKSNFRRDVWKPLMAQAKMPPGLTFHDLRHVANSHMLAQDGNIKAAQERLGHATSRMTLEVYSHILPGHQRAAADAMDGYFEDRPARK